MKQDILTPEQRDAIYRFFLTDGKPGEILDVADFLEKNSGGPLRETVVLQAAWIIANGHVHAQKAELASKLLAMHPDLKGAYDTFKRMDEGESLPNR